MEDLNQKWNRKKHRIHKSVSFCDDANKMVVGELLHNKYIIKNNNSDEIPNSSDRCLPAFLGSDTSKQQSNYSQLKERLTHQQSSNPVFKLALPACKVPEGTPYINNYSTNTPSMNYNGSSYNSVPSICTAMTATPLGQGFEFNSSSSFNNTMNSMNDSTSSASSYSYPQYFQSNHHVTPTLAPFSVANNHFDSAFNNQHSYYHHYLNQISSSPKLIPQPSNPPLSSASVSDTSQAKSSIDYVITHNNNSIRTLISNELGTSKISPVKVSKWSRTGCLTCKARKKKCDESKPVCHECLRVNMTCMYRRASQESSTSNETIKSISTVASPSDRPLAENETVVDGFGIVKVLRAKVDYKFEDGKIVYKA